MPDGFEIKIVPHLDGNWTFDSAGRSVTVAVAGSDGGELDPFDPPPFEMPNTYLRRVDAPLEMFRKASNHKPADPVVVKVMGDVLDLGEFAGLIAFYERRGESLEFHLVGDAK